MLELESKWILPQVVDPYGTTHVDACNGFNNLMQQEMLWTVWHLCLVGTRFTLNLNKNWAQLLLCRPGSLLFTLLIKEGVTQGDPLLVVLYGITHITLTEEIQDSEPVILTPF